MLATLIWLLCQDNELTDTGVKSSHTLLSISLSFLGKYLGMAPFEQRSRISEFIQVMFRSARQLVKKIAIGQSLIITCKNSFTAFVIKPFATCRHRLCISFNRHHAVMR